MTTMRRPYYYHGSEEVADDGKTIVSTVMLGDRGWSPGFAKRICVVHPDRVREVVRKLNAGIHDAEIEAIPELVESAAT